MLKLKEGRKWTFIECLLCAKRFSYMISFNPRNNTVWELFSLLCSLTTEIQTFSHLPSVIYLVNLYDFEVFSFSFYPSVLLISFLQMRPMRCEWAKGLNWCLSLDWIILGNTKMGKIIGENNLTLTLKFILKHLWENLSCSFRKMESIIFPVYHLKRKSCDSLCAFLSLSSVLWVDLTPEMMTVTPKEFCMWL